MKLQYSLQQEMFWVFGKELLCPAVVTAFDSGQGVLQRALGKETG